jgi:hypothetical protein
MPAVHNPMAAVATSPLSKLLLTRAECDLLGDVKLVFPTRGFGAHGT